MAWLGLAASCVALAGCLGGQTGTEATPRDLEHNSAGGTTTKDGSEGGTGAPTLADSPDTAALGCAKDPPAGTAIEEQTGTNANEVVAFLEATDPIRLEYGDGGVTSAVLKISPADNACAAPTDIGPNSLRVSAEVRVQSDDGRAQLLLSGSLEALAAANGGVSGVSLVASRRCESSVDPSTLLPCAITGLDISAYTALIVELSISAQSIAATTRLLGSLRISAVDVTSCTTSPCAASDWNVIAEMALTSGI